MTKKNKKINQSLDEEQEIKPDSTNIQDDVKQLNQDIDNLIRQSVDSILFKNEDKEEATVVQEKVEDVVVVQEKVEDVVVVQEKVEDVVVVQEKVEDVVEEKLMDIIDKVEKLSVIDEKEELPIDDIPIIEKAINIVEEEITPNIEIKLDEVKETITKVKEEKGFFSSIKKTLGCFFKKYLS